MVVSELNCYLFFGKYDRPDVPSVPPFYWQHQKIQRRGKCVFWDHDLNKNTNGGWSSKGCLDPVTTDSDIYKCSCAHMPKFASFAVLMVWTHDFVATKEVVIYWILKCFLSTYFSCEQSLILSGPNIRRLHICKILKKKCPLYESIRSKLTKLGRYWQS